VSHFSNAHTESEGRAHSRLARLENAWQALTRFSLNLSQCELPQATSLALQLVHDALDTEVVFCSTGPGLEDITSTGLFHLSASWCRHFLDCVLAEMPLPGGYLLRSFLEPGGKPASPWPCSAAGVHLEPAPSSWLVALSFHPRRLFEAGDLELLRLARRLLLNHQLLLERLHGCGVQRN
jgi:hypothetical protein